MKIKNKLSLLLTFVISLLLVALNFYIYYISRSHAINDFFYRMQERTYSAANVYLEEDEVSRNKFRQFQIKFLEKLPGETIRIYDSLNHQAFIRDTTSLNYPIDVIEKTRKEKIFRKKSNGVYTYGIFYRDNQGDFVILSSARDVIGEAKLKNLRNILIIGFILSIVILYFISRFLTREMLKPVNEIIDRVNKISDSNLNLRLNEGNGKDELAELAITFNRMLSRLEDSFALQQNFVASASHELRTPLTSIIGNIEVALKRYRNAEEYKVILHTVLEEAERLHKLSDGLLNLAQASSDIRTIKMEYVRIDEILEDARNAVKNQMPESKMELLFENMPENSDDLMFFGNRNLLEIAFQNLMENANKFSEFKKIIVTLINNKDSFLITVRDKGIGIPEKDIDNLFQTFYRAGNARTFSGSGVGLSLCHKIFLIHNGTLSVKSILGQGTKVLILLNKSKNH